jgi:hypothetical protein
MSVVTDWLLSTLLLLLSFTGCDAPPGSETRCWVNIHDRETRQVIETIYVDMGGP